jgi:hypothetical protein
MEENDASGRGPLTGQRGSSFELRQNYDGQYLCTDSAIFNIKITTTPVGAYG